jgi:hypothetical protein
MNATKDYVNATAAKSPGGEEHVWYALRPEVRSPPLRLSDLKQLAQRQQLRHDDFVWHPSWETWRPAGDLAELFTSRGPERAHSEARPALKERARTELRSYVIISAYIWVMLNLMHLHEAVLAGTYHFNLISHGWSIVNALILGKVILIAEALHVGERIANRMPAIAVFIKSFLFGAAILVFHLAEHIVTALWHGQPLAVALDVFRTEGVYQSVMTAAIVSIALVPYVLIKEIEKRTGQKDLLLLAVGLKR